MTPERKYKSMLLQISNKFLKPAHSNTCFHLNNKLLLGLYQKLQQLVSEILFFHWLSTYFSKTNKKLNKKILSYTKNVWNKTNDKDLVFIFTTNNS